MDVLKGLLASQPDAYGLSVQRAIEGDTGRKISIGSVYTTLDRLEIKGLVASEWGEPTSSRGGRRKRLFRITGAGQFAMNSAPTPRSNQAMFAPGRAQEA